jgi:hypothetical protein
MPEDIDKAIITADLIIDTWKKATIEQITKEVRESKEFKDEQDIWKLALALDTHLNENEYSKIGEGKLLVGKKLKKKKS